MRFYHQVKKKHIEITEEEDKKIRAKQAQVPNLRYHQAYDRLNQQKLTRF